MLVGMAPLDVDELKGHTPTARGGGLACGVKFRDAEYFMAARTKDVKPDKKYAPEARTVK